MRIFSVYLDETGNVRQRRRLICTHIFFLEENTDVFCHRKKRNGFLLFVLSRHGRVNIGLFRLYMQLYLWLSLAATGRSPLVHLGHALHEPRHIISWSPSYFFFRIHIYYILTFVSVFRHYRATVTHTWKSF